MFKSKNSHSGNSSSSSIGCNNSSSACKLFETNPLHLTFEIGPLIGNGGPEGVWRIHKGTSKDENKVGEKIFFACLKNVFNMTNTQ